MVWDASLEVDRERLEGFLPARASGADLRSAEVVEVPHRKVEQSQRGLLGRELAAVACDLAEPGVHRLDQVRRVDDPAHPGRERQERHELGPVAARSVAAASLCADRAGR